MPQQVINTGTQPGDRTGDPLRDAFIKVNQNFAEIYARDAVGANFDFTENAITATNTNGNIELVPNGSGQVVIDSDANITGVVSAANATADAHLLNRGTANGLYATSAAVALKANLAGPTAFTGAVSSAAGIGICGNSTLFNTNIGRNTLVSNTTGGSNTATGDGALSLNTSGEFNTAVGRAALSSNTTGGSNTATGHAALQSNTTGVQNTAAGVDALQSNTTFNNCTGLGFNAAVTGSNQVQLGDSATTTYVYGTVQNRSDARDKADIRDTRLGLNFVNSLRPVDFRYDFRDAYKPDRPAQPAAVATPEQVEAYEAAMAEWLEAVKLKKITGDGSKKRSRYHSGVIAQELRSAIDAAGFDAKGWGALQDHSIDGGDDVLSVGYDQFVAPLIKAIQELSTQVSQLQAEVVLLKSSAE